MDHTRWRRPLMLALRTSLFALALFALSRELRDVDHAGFAASLAGYGWPRMTLAIIATGASFLALGTMDVLALRAAGAGTRALPVGSALLTGFVAHAFSQAIGFGFLTQGAVRLRAYGKRAITAPVIATASVIVTAAETVGLLAFGAVALLAVRPSLRIAQVTLPARPLGVLLAAAVLTVLLWGLASPRRTGKPPWLPSPPALARLLTLSMLDWMLAASVLFLLLPAGLAPPLGGFLAAYAVAQLLAVASHVPAGAGVFEATIIGFLAVNPTPETVAALMVSMLAYRACYYLLPLAVAIVIAVRADLPHSPVAYS